MSANPTLIFALGPLEWVWRSLTYLDVQPFRHRPDQLAETGLLA
jgi:uncharacterized membrane protein YeiB